MNDRPRATAGGEGRGYLPAPGEDDMPLCGRWYLPEDWAEDTHRRKVARVPEEIVFQTEQELVWLLRQRVTGRRLTIRPV